jgi:hypothetical protein
MTTEGPRLTRAELAAALGVSVSTVHGLALAEELGVSWYVVTTRAWRLGLALAHGYTPEDAEALRASLRAYPLGAHPREYRP